MSNDVRIKITKTLGENFEYNIFLDYGTKIIRIDTIDLEDYQNEIEGIVKLCNKSLMNVNQKTDDLIAEARLKINVVLNYVNDSKIKLANTLTTSYINGGFSNQINSLMEHYIEFGNFDSFKDYKLTILDSIPQVLTNIGFKGEKLTLSVAKFFKIIYDHRDELDSDTLKQLPYKISKPLAIIKSKKEDTIVMIIDLNNKDNHKLIVPISLQDKHDEFDIDNVWNESNLNISTVYGSGDYGDSSAINSLNQAIYRKEVIYINFETNSYKILSQLCPKIKKYNSNDFYDFRSNNAQPFYSKSIGYKE